MNPGPPPERRHVRRRLYLFAFVDELGPLLAIYTLWFADHGITAEQVSLVFVLWAALGIVLEVPSGALADRIDRRRLVASAMVLRASGIGVWLIWPTLTGVVVGAVLWAIHTATASGTWEALVHDELSALDAADQYPVMMARIGQCSHIGTALGGALATGLLALGVDFWTLGVITVALHLPAMWAVLSLPHVQAAPDDDDDEDQDDGALTFASWWRTIKLGTQATVRQGPLTLVVITAAIIEGLFILDEYVPLLARFRDAPDTWVPVLVIAVWGGLIGGGEIAARAPHMRGAGLSALIALGVVAAVVALTTGSFWTLALIGVTYGAMNAAWVLTEARMQALAPPKARATTRSVVALIGGIISAGAFLVVRGLADGENPAPGMLVLLAGLATAGVLLLWLPRPLVAPGADAEKAQGNDID